MRVVVQKCKNAKVTVDNNVVGESSFGLLLLVGFTQGDNFEKIEKMTQKIIKLRIFEDQNNIMNESILDKNGSILVVSQFTLYADTKKGNRPSYKNALNGNEAEILYECFKKELEKFVPVQSGCFGKHMEVLFTNSGPTTILLEG